MFVVWRGRGGGGLVGRLRETALWSTSSVIYHSSQAKEESSSCSVSQTISSLRTPAAVLVEESKTLMIYTNCRVKEYFLCSG